MFDIKDALKEIDRGSVEIIDIEYIEKVLTSYLKDKKPYYVKAGFDPTAPDLHLGHTVLIHKLAVFQKYGATIQFIIGDFTATIGDPTGKNETRKKLDRELVLENSKSYQDQIFKILDPKKTQILFNSHWIDKLGASGILELTTTLNVARMLERDDFSKRYKTQTPISISEFLYPLLQGYDSVFLKSDIELGGTDQKFNLLMGRTLQKIYNTNKQQAVIMMPLLEGLDGINKMSKSLNNYIGIDESADSIFGKILSINDELMWRYYELLSSRSIGEIEDLKNSVKDGTLHPKKAKELLALEIVERYHNRELALKAKEEFDNIHQKHKLPSDIKEYSVDGTIWIAKALVETELEPSTSAARRDIKQGAVKIDQNRVDDEQLKLDRGSYILQVGKRKFAKIEVL